MLSKSRRSPVGVSSTRGSPNRIPRTMPVTQPGAMDFSISTTRTEDCNYALTSSCPGSRGLNSVNPEYVSYHNYPDSSADAFFLSTPSSTSYAPTSSGPIYPVSLMPTMASLDSGPYDDFLADTCVSTSSPPEVNFVSVSYPGQPSPQDMLNAFVDMSMCGPPMMSNYYRQCTPPPEEFIQECLPYYTVPQDIQDDLCHVEPDFAAMYEVNDVRHSSSHSMNTRHIAQPRPIRSASERSDLLDEAMISMETRLAREDPVDRVKVRNDPLYAAKPQEDGKYHCPMKSTGCNHEPTGQRCIYNKYLDSHLRPYRCKYTDAECDDARFSSNACLFRHEREAHGLHNHGVNPFLCRFQDCDRARTGNGFPRRWNLRDHMKRVHEFDEAKCDKHVDSTEPTKRRKGSGVPTSTPMKRSTSSAHAKEKAMAGAAMPKSKYSARANQAGYGVPRMVTSPVECAVSRYTTLDNVQFSSTTAVPRTTRHPFPLPYGPSHSAYPG